mmetsp:Transcript_4378/g.8507  ORF Transcript_4378/g.8507 Transcript_4378/m.8507 type:complete len:360 (-) Transcript_4378:272-1351(-)
MSAGTDTEEEASEEAAADVSSRETRAGREDMSSWTLTLSLTLMLMWTLSLPLLLPLSLSLTSSSPSSLLLLPSFSASENEDVNTERGGDKWRLCVIGRRGSPKYGLSLLVSPSSGKGISSVQISHSCDEGRASTGVATITGNKSGKSSVSSVISSFSSTSSSSFPSPVPSPSILSTLPSPPFLPLPPPPFTPSSPSSLRCWCCLPTTSVGAAAAAKLAIDSSAATETLVSFAEAPSDDDAVSISSTLSADEASFGAANAFAIGRVVDGEACFLSLTSACTSNSTLTSTSSSHFCADDGSGKATQTMGSSAWSSAGSEILSSGAARSRDGDGGSIVEVPGSDNAAASIPPSLPDKRVEKN